MSNSFQALGDSGSGNEFAELGGGGSGNEFAELGEGGGGGGGGSGTLGDIPKRWFLLMGQSNMSGRDTAFVEGVDDVVTDPLITMLDTNDAEIPAVQPVHFDKVDQGSPEEQGYCSAIRFAQRVREATGAAVGLIPVAVGGTYLYQWDPNDAGSGNGEGALYDEAIRLAGVATALGGSIAGALWCQGEADGLSGGADPDPRGDFYADRVADYDSRLEGMIASLRSDLGEPALPFIAYQIRTEGGGSTIRTYYSSTFEGAVSNAKFVADDGGALIDAFHYSRATQYNLGTDAAQAYLQLTGEALPQAPGDYVVAIGNEKTTHTWTNDPDTTTYNLLRRTAGVGAYVEVASDIASGYEDTGLTNGTEYEYILEVVNANGADYSVKKSSTPNANIGAVQLTAADGQYLQRVASEAAISGGELTLYVRVLYDSLPATNQNMGIVSVYGSSAAKQVMFFRLRDVGGASKFWEATVYSNSGAGQARVTWAATVSTATVYRFRLKWDGAQSGAANQWTLEIWNSGTESWDDQGTPSVVTDNTISAISNSTTGELSVGALSDFESSSYHDGRVDEVDIYSDLAETQQEYYYPLDADATDASGNSRDLTEFPGTGTITYGDPLN